MAKRTSKTETDTAQTAEIITSEGAVESGERSNGGTPTAAPLPPDSNYLYLYNEDTGELRQVVVRQGYAPAPMPVGFRIARDEEIPGR